MFELYGRNHSLLFAKRGILYEVIPDLLHVLLFLVFLLGKHSEGVGFGSFELERSTCFCFWVCR